MGFSINNISSGMWKVIIFLGVLVFVVLYFGNSKGYYYAYAVGGICFLIFIIGSTHNIEYVERRTEDEARKIADDYIKNKIDMKNKDFNITLPDGKIEYDGCYMHDEKEGLTIPEWEIGFHIIPRFKNYHEYYSILIHGLKEPLTVKGLRELKKPYFAEPYKIKYVLVDITDSKKYQSANIMVYHHNREEGFED